VFPGYFLFFVFCSIRADHDKSVAQTMTQINFDQKRPCFARKERFSSGKSGGSAKMKP
jgi:hypothetical protein